MKTLVLGATGMLGHRIYHVLSKQMEVWGTVRKLDETYARFLKPYQLISGTHAEDLASIEKAIQIASPNVVINCIGIIKQKDEARQAIPSIYLNALFPHYLAGLCAKYRARLIQISTDCVFSGLRGNYSEDDIPDPVDLYGRTKLLGELSEPGCLTIRTSVIGWELNGYKSLLEWFASQRGRTIKGYRKAIYTGFSTTVFANLLRSIVEKYSWLTGIYHIASEPISKYELLLRLRNALGWYDITIEHDDSFSSNRSLNGGRFVAETGWKPPSWSDMIEGLVSEWAEYYSWRSNL